MSQEIDLKREIDKYIVWKDNIGYLPGSPLRFKHDDNGELCLMDEENIDSLRKRQKLIKDSIFNDEDQQANYEISICSKCLKSDFKENLVRNNKYCKKCASLDQHLYKIYKNLSTQTILNGEIEQNIQSSKNNFSSNFEMLNYFDWDKYLCKYNAEAIPEELFLPEQSFPTTKNEFEVGMKLEGIDPTHPSKFCVLTIDEIQGHRLRLHFDGYHKKYDFWVNADSKFIFPPGFCARTGRQLEHPPEIGLFDWESYLSTTNSKSAPKDLFSITKIDLSKSNKINDGFEKNLKLEAVDKANVCLICVATIKDRINDHVLIHFDGWDDNFDYWTHVTSPFLRPIGWCMSTNDHLCKPGKWGTEPFFWEEYLKNTNSKSVPEQAFIRAKKKKKNFVHLWKPGMKLEAVDKRNPHLIRVASFVSRSAYSVKIHYEGWDEKYDCTFEEDSPDLHPIKWCLKTGHKLEPPPDKFFSKLNTLCPVPCCNGFGNKKWYNQKMHFDEKECPYSTANYVIRNVYNYENNRFQDPHGKKSIYPRTTKISNYETLQEKINPYYLKMIKDNYLEMKFTIRNFRSLKISNQYVKSLGFKPIDILDFDYLKIEEVIEKLTDNKETASIFRQEKIDGISFLCMKQEDINQKLKINLSCAVKILPFIFTILESLFRESY